MAEEEDQELNAGAMRRAGAATERSEQLAEMRLRFISVASAEGLFGTAPNGATAEEALATVAAAMLDQLSRAGYSVADITASAGRAADIADETDENAQGRLVSAADAIGYLNDFLHVPAGGQERGGGAGT
ncbi:hypothetical protein [Streptomyces mayteni]